MPLFPFSPSALTLQITLLHTLKSTFSTVFLDQNARSVQNPTQKMASYSSRSFSNLPKVPFFSVLITVMDKFYIEGKTTQEIANHFSGKGSFATPSFIQCVVGTTATSWSVNTQATQRIKERLEMCEYILSANQVGSSKETIQSSCSQRGFKPNDGLVDNLMKHAKNYRG